MDETEEELRKRAEAAEAELERRRRLKREAMRRYRANKKNDEK